MTTFHPLTSESWADFEKLFGPRGACGGCWCMYWRLSRARFTEQQGELNRRNIRAIVDAGIIPGILAYSGDEPIGWCSIAPREEFPTLGRSRILKPDDDQPVWSVVCFYVARDRRRKGLSVDLLNAALEFAMFKGARIVEGYPVDPKTDQAPAVFIYTGVLSAYIQAGFTEVLRRSETRPIMRCYL
jgi:GNAT superfamily N-acetyltransferase